MFKYFSLLLIVLYATASNAELNNKCIIPFGSKSHWDVFWPLIFDEKGYLYETETVDGIQVVSIPENENVIISCGPNYVKNFSRSEHIKVRCLQDGEFSVITETPGADGSDSDINTLLSNEKSKQFACDLRVIEEVLVTVNNCPDKGTSVKFGFVHPVDKLAHITGEACYSIPEGRTIFAHIRLGKEDYASSLEILNKTFFRQLHPQSRYKLEFMKAFHLDEFNNRLRKTLNIVQVPEFRMSKYVDDTLLWNKQMVGTKKLAWNYFVLHENLFNLELLKEDIRDLQENVDVYLGSHGIASVRNVNGDKIQIYLKDERFPVPKIVWITVQSKNKATSFAVVNDPTIMEEELEKNPLCESKCESISWLKRIAPTSVHKSTKHGYVFCCNHHDLQERIPEMPRLDEVKELLN